MKPAGCAADAAGAAGRAVRRRLLLDEALSPAQFGGALLVLAGMAVNTFGLPRRRAAIAR